MGISRFENFKAVDFDDMALNAPDTQGLDQLLGQFQTEYDTGVAKLQDAQFKNLAKDDVRSGELRKAQYQMVDDIADSYVGSVAEGRRNMAQGLMDLSRDYKEGGERYQINQNYQSFMTAREELKKRLGKGEKAGGITQAQMEAWQQYTLGNYKGAVGDDFGVYGGISIDEVAGYVDGNMRAEKLAKNWKPDKLKNGTWWTKDGYMYKKTIRGEEIVPEEEVMAELTAALGRDAQLTNYLTQYAAHTGQELDLNNIGQYVSKDQFEYNRANPLVQFAQTASKKWAYKHVLKDEDINLSLEKQRRSFAYKDRKDKEKFMMDNVITLSNNDVRTNQFKSITDAQKTVDGLTDNINATRGYLKKTDIPQAERENYEAQLAKLEIERANSELLVKEAMEVVPEYRDLVNAMEETAAGAGLDGTQQSQAYAAALQALTTTETISTGVDGVVTHEVQAPLTADNLPDAALAYQTWANDNGGNMTMAQATALIEINFAKEQIQRKSDVAMNRYLKNNQGKYIVAQPQISIDPRDYNGTKAGGKETPFMNVTRDLKDSPDVFTFHDPVTGEMGSGQSFYDKLQGTMDEEIDFTTIKMHKFQPSTTYYNRGKAWNAQDGGVATVRTKGGDGVAPRTIQINFGFKKNVSDNHAEAIKKYYNEYGSQNAKNLIAKQDARNADPGKSWARLESGQQFEHVIDLPRQRQHGDDYINNAQLGIARIQAQSGNASDDTYAVKFGGQNKSFSTSSKAEEYSIYLKQLAGDVSNMSKEDALTYVKDQGLNDATATSFINTVKY